MLISKARQNKIYDSTVNTDREIKVGFFADHLTDEAKAAAKESYMSGSDQPLKSGCIIEKSRVALSHVSCTKVALKLFGDGNPVLKPNVISFCEKIMDAKPSLNEFHVNQTNVNLNKTSQTPSHRKILSPKINLNSLSIIDNDNLMLAIVIEKIISSNLAVYQSDVCDLIFRLSRVALWERCDSLFDEVTAL